MRIYDFFKDQKIPLDNTVCYGEDGKLIELRNWDQKINQDILFVTLPKGEGDESSGQGIREVLGLAVLFATAGNPALSVAAGTALSLVFSIYDYYDSLSLEELRQPLDLKEFNFQAKSLNISLNQLTAGGQVVPELFGKYRYKAPRIYQNDKERTTGKTNNAFRIPDLITDVSVLDDSDRAIGLKMLDLLATKDGYDYHDLIVMGYRDALHRWRPPDLRGFDFFREAAFYGTRFNIRDLTSSNMRRYCIFVRNLVEDLISGDFATKAILEGKTVEEQVPLSANIVKETFTYRFGYSFGKGPVRVSEIRAQFGGDVHELSALEANTGLDIEFEYEDGSSSTREENILTSLFTDDLTDANFVPSPFPTNTSLPTGSIGDKFRYIDHYGYKGAYDSTIDCTQISLDFSFGFLNSEDITEEFSGITLRERDFFIPIWFDLVIDNAFEDLSTAQSALSNGSYDLTTYSDLTGFENQFTGTTFDSDDESPSTDNITEIGTGTVEANEDIVDSTGSVYKEGKAIRIHAVTPPEDPTPDDGMEYEPTEEELMNGISLPVSESFTKLFFEVDITTLDATNTFIEVYTGTKKALFEIRNTSILFVPETGDSVEIGTYRGLNTTRLSFEIDGTSLRVSAYSEEVLTYTIPFTNSTDGEKINIYTKSQTNDLYLQNIRYNLGYTDDITDDFLRDSSLNEGIFLFRFPTVTPTSFTVPELAEVVDLGDPLRYYIVEPNDKMPVFIVASKIRQSNSNLYRGGEWNISDITGFTADSDYYYSVFYPSVERIQQQTNKEFVETFTTINFPKNSQAEDIKIYRVKVSDLFRSGSQAFPTEQGDLIEYGDATIEGTNYAYTYLTRMVIRSLKDVRTGGEAQGTIDKQFENWLSSSSFNPRLLSQANYFEYNNPLSDFITEAADFFEDALGHEPDIDTVREQEQFNSYYRDVYQYVVFGLEELNTAIQNTYNEGFSRNQEHITSVIRSLETVTFFCERSVPDYFSTSNPFIRTSNPAHICLYILGEYVNRTSIYDTIEDLVDMDSFREFRDYCSSNNLEFNGVFDFDTNVFDALRSVAITGRSIIDFSRGKVRIITPVKKTSRSAIFSSRNLNDFKREVLFKQKPDALKADFVNEDENYNIDQVTEYFEGKSASNARDIRDISLFGITDRSQARSHLRFLIDRFDLGKEVFSFTVSLLNLGLERGDLIGINHELIEGDHVTFRVLKRLIHENTVPNDPLDGYIDGVISDQKNFPELDFANNEYMIQVVTDDGTTHNIDIDRVETVAMEDETHDNMETSTGDQVLNSNNEVVLLTPLQYKSLVFKDSQLPNLFQEGNICYFGRKTSIFKDCLVVSIESTGAFEARITATPQI